MKKRGLALCALAALLVAAVLSGCGNNLYFAGRILPPSGIANRVLIAIQNPSAFSKGELEIVDAYYDIRQSYNDRVSGFTIAGYSGSEPATIQNMPEEQVGAVYGSGDGSFTLVNYQKENNGGAIASLGTLSASIFVTRNQSYVFAADQQAHVFTVVNKLTGKQYSLGLPGVYRVSTNPGGSVALAFVQNSNYAYYPRLLQSFETTAYSGGPSTWPPNAVDCEPINAPGACLFQVADSNHNPIQFDRPIKALWSADGSTAYILNCGPECGGNQSSVALVPTAPLILQSGQQSGSVPSSPTTILTPGGASNGLVNTNTLYVYGEQPQQDGLFAGFLTPIDLTTNTAGNPIAVSDAAPGQPTKMVLADDNTLWLGGVRCEQGERYAKGEPYGCLTMFNTATNSVTLLEPFQGDLTGIAAVLTLHKVYVAEGGQVYIFSTTSGSAINNFYVAVTGTAYDVAYMDATTDADNTDY